MMAAPLNNVVVETAYTSVGCNRTPHALDWGNNDLVCFASSRYDQKFAGNHGKILHTLYEHQEKVNCVRWIQDELQSPEKEFVSASVDKTVMVWACRKTLTGITCSKVSQLIGLETSVNSVDGFYWNYKDSIATVVVAVGGDQICVWSCEMFDGEWNVLQKFSSKPVLMFDCVINLLPGCQVPPLSCAGDDGS